MSMCLVLYAVPKATLISLVFRATLGFHEPGASAWCRGALRSATCSIKILDAARLFLPSSSSPDRAGRHMHNPRATAEKISPTTSAWVPRFALASRLKRIKVTGALIEIGRLSARGRNSTECCTHQREWDTCHEQEACSSRRPGPPILRTGSALCSTWPLACAQPRRPRSRAQAGRKELLDPTAVILWISAPAILGS